MLREDCAGARRHRASDRVGVETETFRGRERHAYTHRARSLDHAVVCDVARLADDDLLSGIDQAQDAGEERTLRAGEHHHLLRIHPLGSEPLVVEGDRLAQRQVARGCGIARPPAPQAAFGGLDDGGRRVEVRVPHPEQDHVLPRVEAPPCMVVNLPDMGGIDVEASGKCGIAHPFHLDRLLLRANRQTITISAPRGSRPAPLMAPTWDGQAEHTRMRSIKHSSST